MQESTDAFNHLKEALSAASVLVLPEFTKNFMLELNASDRGIGAVLM